MKNETKYMKNVIEHFCANYEYRDFVPEDTFIDICTIYQNFENINEIDRNRISKLFVSLNPMNKIPKEFSDKISEFASKYDKKLIAEYVDTEKGSRIFLSKKNEKILIKANKENVIVSNIFTGKKLAEMGWKNILEGGL